MKSSIKIAAGQGFYGDSLTAALAIASEKAADYIVHDALAELTLSILQKDRQKDAGLGYARDIELMAVSLFPLAFKNGIKIVTNSGGLNPLGAAEKVAGLLRKGGIKGLKIAAITGDDMLGRLPEFVQGGYGLENMDTGEKFSSSQFLSTHANVYTGAASVCKALDEGADIVLAGRVADPCLTLGILVHHFGWGMDKEFDKLASGIAIGHLLECGGQASGGNSYAEWNNEYKISNLGYPIAEVEEDGSAVFTKLKSQGGKISSNTLREQLVYEIHDPANYITPDVVVDLTNVTIEDAGENKVKFCGAKGKLRPQQLKMTVGLMEGYLTEQFFFFSWPFAYRKAQKFIGAVKEIWSNKKFSIERFEYSYVGINGIHCDAVSLPPENVLDELNEIGVRLAIKHTDANTGKAAMQSIVCLALNGPPGLVSVPGWGNVNKALYGLWPTLMPRELIKEEIKMFEV